MPQSGSTPGRPGAYVNVTDLSDGCPVCGHADQCSALADASVVWCFRPHEWTGGNATRTKHAKDGREFATFHRDSSGNYAPGAGRADVPTDDIPPDPSEADRRRHYSHDRLSVDDLDRAYRGILETLDVSIGHQQQLLAARGFSRSEVDRALYRTFPTSLDAEQHAINAAFKAILTTFAPEALSAAREAQEIVADVFGQGGSLRDHVARQLGHDGIDELAAKLLGVPGIWREPQDEGGRWRFGVPGTSGLLIPTLDPDGRIVALTIRLDSPAPRGARYLPPTSPKKLDKGARSGSPSAIAAHVPLGSSRRARVAVITEGNLKADRASGWVRERFGEDAVIIAVPNVGTYWLGIDLAIEMGADTVVLAFDVDSKRKGGVAGALTAAMCEAAKSVHVGVLAWPENSGKGIDDVLQRGHADTIKILGGDAAWPFIAETRASAGLPEHSGVAARIALVGVVERTKGDLSYPLDPRIVRALAVLDATSREFQRVRAELEKKLKAKGMAALDKAIRQARKVAEQVEQEPANSAVVAPVYVEEDGCTCIVRGEARQRLANFTARISRVIVRDDGQEAHHQCVVTGKTADGRTLSPLTLDGAAFGDVASWVRDSSWLGLARVEAGRDVSGHLASAIERASVPERSVVYTHTGWRVVDGRTVYLMPEHLENVTVALDQVGGRYHLPPPPSLRDNEDLRRAVRLSVDLADGVAPSSGTFLPMAIMAPVMCGVYTAPLSTALEIDFTIWLSGTSGGCKSSVSALAMSHYGTFNYNSLPLSWTSTANRIEWALFHLKDTLSVVDDYKADLPGVTAGAARIVQQVGNRSDRGRLNRNSGAMASRPPRGLVLSTGEELPRSVSDSTPGRLIAVRVEAGVLAKAAIIDCMTQAPMYRLAMSGYVTWLALNPTKMTDAVARRDDQTAKLSDQLGEGVHARAARNLATLVAGCSTFLGFAVDIGAIERSDADRRLQNVLDALVHVGKGQAEATAETSPVDRYMSAVSTLLSNGTRTLAHRDEPMTKTDIGWDDPDSGRLYLDHEHAWHAIETWHREAGKQWPYDRTSLHRALVERGMVRDGKDPRHPGLRKVRVGGRGKSPQWVLDLDRAHLEPALRGESAEAVAARKAAAEAEAEESARVLARAYGDGAYPARGGTS